MKLSGSGLFLLGVFLFFFLTDTISLKVIVGTQLSGAGLPGWGVQHGSQTIHFLGRTTMIMIFLLFWDRWPGEVGLSYLSHCGFFLYVFSCGKSFLLIFKSFSYTFSVSSCNSDVFLGGDEFRVFLLAHLGHISHLPCSFDVTTLRCDFFVCLPYFPKSIVRHGNLIFYTTYTAFLSFPISLIYFPSYASWDTFSNKSLVLKSLSKGFLLGRVNWTQCHLVTAQYDWNEEYG